MPSTLEQRFAAAGVKVGDRVRITRDGGTDEGVLMPRHAFSAADVAIIKLDSGYNVGVRVGQAAQIERVAGAQRPPRPERVPARREDLPTVAILGTGGTIASYVDYRTGAVHPAASAEELAFATPELFDFVNVEAELVFQVFSEDLQPAHWLELAKRVKAAFDRGARGVVIPHGTDTLGYTSAALAFLVRDLPGPVVLVGAQRSSDRPSSDAATNLLAACRLAAQADLGEVVACMHAGPDDDRIAVHRGVRVRKNHTSRRDAFESVNARPLGFVTGDDVDLSGSHRPRHAGPCRVADAVAEDVGLVYAYPGLDADAVRAQLRGRGAVLVGTGLGHVPDRTLEAIRAASARGALLVMTSQCLWGRVDLKVYSRGRDLTRAGVVSGDDMLPEAAYAKLCWALGNAADRDEAARWMAADQVGESDPRTEMV